MCLHYIFKDVTELLWHAFKVISLFCKDSTKLFLFSPRKKRVNHFRKYTHPLRIYYPAGACPDEQFFSQLSVFAAKKAYWANLPGCSFRLLERKNRNPACLHSIGKIFPEFKPKIVFKLNWPVETAIIYGDVANR